jgi:hypothetical protein
MRRLGRITALFGMAGLAIPGVFFVFAKSLERGAYDNTWLSTPALLLWPSSLLFLGSAGLGAADELGLLVLSTTINVATYLALGVLIWIGLNKQRWVLHGTLGGLLILWMLLLSL